MRKAGLILLLITSCMFAQQGKLIGKIKSVREELVDLKNKPAKECDWGLNFGGYSSYDSYEMGWVDSSRYDSEFYNHWNTGDIFIYRNFKTEYNPKGQKTTETWYDGEAVRMHYQFQYNENDSVISIKKTGKPDEGYIDDQYNYENGVLVSHSEINYNAQNKVNYETLVKNTYNEKKQLVKVQNYEESELKSTLTYTYFDNSKPKELLITEVPWNFPENEKPTEVTYPIRAWRYDGRNKLLNEIEMQRFSDSRDSIIAIDTTTQEKICGNVFVEYVNKQVNTKILAVKNDLSKSTWWEDIDNSVRIYYYDYDFKANESVITNKIIIRYNNRHQEIERTKTNDRVTEHNFTEYNDEGQMTKQHKEDTGNEDLGYFYENDNLIKVEIKNRIATRIVTFSYKFDTKGNWTEQTKSIDGKPLFTLKRTIEYYE